MKDISKSHILLCFSIILGFVLHGVITQKSCVREGTLAGHIAFKDRGEQGPQDNGCRIKFYDNFVVVDTYPPGESNGAVSVYPLSEIERIVLQK